MADSISQQHNNNTENKTNHSVGRYDGGTRSTSSRSCGDTGSDWTTTQHVLERSSHTAVDEDTYYDGDDHTEQDTEEYCESNGQSCCSCVSEWVGE